MFLPRTERLDVSFASPGSKNARSVRVNIMVEGKGFYLSTSRNSADFAGVVLPETAQDGPRERFRVNRRQPFSA